MLFIRCVLLVLKVLQPSKVKRKVFLNCLVRKEVFGEGLWFATFYGIAKSFVNCQSLWRPPFPSIFQMTIPFFAQAGRAGRKKPTSSQLQIKKVADTVWQNERDESTKFNAFQESLPEITWICLEMCCSNSCDNRKCCMPLEVVNIIEVFFPYLVHLSKTSNWWNLLERKKPTTLRNMSICLFLLFNVYWT